ncbi:hypothetical protein GY631_4666 [Trichophyton interdigitale]|nr:hypothetical protein GY631_4666 [Trichophyton interdigitale]KAG5217802.1 hypothetical protein GY632_6191 [Trichophyton interdigitale]
MQALSWAGHVQRVVPTSPPVVVVVVVTAAAAAAAAAGSSPPFDKPRSRNSQQSCLGYRVTEHSGGNARA